MKIYFYFNYKILSQELFIIAPQGISLYVAKLEIFH